MKGLFLTLEGIDGVGKTIIAKSLVEELNKRGFKAVYTHEPTNGPYGEILSRILRGEVKVTWAWEKALLFVLDRAWHVREFIRPYLAKGAVIVCDRYIHSQLAYQAADGLDRELLEYFNKDFPFPDLVIYLDSDPSIALSRMRKFVEENRAFHKRSIHDDVGYLASVREHYMEYIKQRKLMKNCLIIDIDREIGSTYLPKEVFLTRVRRLVLKLADCIVNRFIIHE